MGDTHTHTHTHTHTAVDSVPLVRTRTRARRQGENRLHARRMAPRRGAGRKRRGGGVLWLRLTHPVVAPCGVRDLDDSDGEAIERGRRVQAVLRRAPEARRHGDEAVFGEARAGVRAVALHAALAAVDGATLAQHLARGVVGDGHAQARRRVAVHVRGLQQCARAPSAHDDTCQCDSCCDTAGRPNAAPTLVPSPAARERGEERKDGEGSSVCGPVLLFTE